MLGLLFVLLFSNPDFGMSGRLRSQCGAVHHMTLDAFARLLPSTLLEGLYA